MDQNRTRNMFQVRLSGVRASIAVAHIRKFYKICKNIVRFRFSYNRWKIYCYIIFFQPKDTGLTRFLSSILTCAKEHIPDYWNPPKA